jgi:uncharacterized membrane protein
MSIHKTYRRPQTESTKWTLTVEAIAAGLIILFLFTGIDKLYNYRQFRDALNKSPVLANVAGLVAWSLPVAEILVAAALLIPSMKKTGLKATILLLAVFTIYLSYMMAFAPKLPCMCAGLLESLSWKSHIIFNAVMIVLAIIGIVASGKSSSAGSRAPPT